MAIFLACCTPAAARAALPDGRVYELVSPVQKNGVNPFGATPSTNGDAVDFQAYGAFAGATSGSANLYQAARTGAGWETKPLTPTPTKPLGTLEQQVPLFYSPDLSEAIFTTGQSYTANDDDEGSLDLYSSTGGSPAWLSQGAAGGAAPDQVTYDGATSNGSHVVFSSAESLTANAQGLASGGGGEYEPEYLYVRVPATGQTELVDVNDSDELISPEGAILGNGTKLTVGAPPVTEFVPAGLSGTTTNAVSSDGSKIFFQSAGNLYMRENDSNTVEIAEKAQYEGASSDGSLVFFSNTVETELFNGGAFDPEEINKHLFEFNTTSHEIGPAAAMSTLPISAGDFDVAETTLTEGFPGESVTLTVASTAGFHVGEDIRVKTNTTGFMTIASIPDSTHIVITQTQAESIAEGSTVEGTPRRTSISAVSNDGSHVYLVSTAVLAENENAEHQTAVDYEPNLYVFDTNSGESSFITRLTAADVAAAAEGVAPNLVADPDTQRPAVPTPDGSQFVFASTGDLTGQNPEEQFQEIYRYTAADGSLVCISCTAEGVAPTGNASLGETAGGSYDPVGTTGTAISADGSRVFFETPDALVEGDRNGTRDVYEWEGGHASLISDGQSSSASTLTGTTPSGDDVLFVTEASLLGADIDGGVPDVYDARVGGGFTEPVVSTTPPCGGEECRGASAPPPVFGAPDSSTSKGAGNLPAPAAVKAHKASCRKGFTRKRVKGKSKCVRKKAKKARSGARRTSSAVVNHRSL